MTSPTHDIADTRKVGAAEVTIISEGGLRWAPKFPIPASDWRAAAPDSDEQGRVPLGLNSAVIRLDGQIVFIDPCLDDEGTEASNDFLRSFTATFRTAGGPAVMRQLGVAPEAVSAVVITHTHDDHLTGTIKSVDGQDVPRFPNSRYLVGAADYEQSLNAEVPLEARAAHCLRVLDQHKLLDGVDQETELLPGITVIPTPGETAGHQIVRLQSEGETFFYVGDLLHHAAEVAHPTWVSPYRDEPAMVRSRRLLLEEAADSQAIVVFTHARFPGWGRVFRTDDGFRWEWI